MLNLLVNIVKLRVCNLNKNGNSQRTRLRSGKEVKHPHRIPLGSAWLTSISTSTITLTLVTYCYNSVVGIGLKSSYIYIDDEREIK